MIRCCTILYLVTNVAIFRAELCAYRMEKFNHQLQVK